MDINDDRVVSECIRFGAGLVVVWLTLGVVYAVELADRTGRPGSVLMCIVGASAAVGLILDYIIAAVDRAVGGDDE